MQFARNGAAPSIHPSARVAESATLVGDVRVGAECFIDHNVVVESGGPPVRIEDEALVFAGSIIRSVGGTSRPPFAVRVGPRTLVSPLCVLTGCSIDGNCYLATNAIVLQGATVGLNSRLGVGSVVHAMAPLPPGSRVGMREIAVYSDGQLLITANVEAARERLARAGFFEHVFGFEEESQATLHEEAIRRLLEEVLAWRDEGVNAVPSKARTVPPPGSE